MVSSVGVAGAVAGIAAGESRALAAIRVIASCGRLRRLLDRYLIDDDAVGPKRLDNRVALRRQPAMRLERVHLDLDGKAIPVHCHVCRHLTEFVRLQLDLQRLDGFCGGRVALGRCRDRPGLGDAVGARSQRLDDLRSGAGLLAGRRRGRNPVRPRRLYGSRYRVTALAASSLAVIGAVPARTGCDLPGGLAIGRGRFVRGSGWRLSVLGGFRQTRYCALFCRSIHLVQLRQERKRGVVCPRRTRSRIGFDGGVDHTSVRHF